MTTNPDTKYFAHIDASEIREDLRDGPAVCPDHPNVEPEVGFGLAGGGYGPYTYCGQCGKLLSKQQDQL